MVRRVIAFGHSHIGALNSAYDKLRRDMRPEIQWSFKQLWGRYHPFVRSNEPHLLFNEELEADLQGLCAETRDECIFLGSLIGSEHFLWGVRGQIRPFDIVLPFDESMPMVPDAEILPYSLIYRFAFDEISQILKFNGRLKLITGRPVYQLLPPPPVANPDRVLAYAPDEMRDELTTYGVPHAAIRCKLWKLWVFIASEIAAQSGVALCDCPPEAVDKDGMLREEYCGDAVHGNEHYGLHAIRRFEQMAQGG